MKWAPGAGVFLEAHIRGVILDHDQHQGIFVVQRQIEKGPAVEALHPMHDLDDETVAEMLVDAATVNLRVGPERDVSEAQIDGYRLDPDPDHATTKMIADNDETVVEAIRIHGTEVISGGVAATDLTQGQKM